MNLKVEVMIPNNKAYLYCYSLTILVIKLFSPVTFYLWLELKDITNKLSMKLELASR